MKQGYHNRLNEFRTELIEKIYQNGSVQLLDYDDEDFTEKISDVPTLWDTDKHGNFHLTFCVLAIEVDHESGSVTLSTMERDEDYGNREYDANDADIYTLIEICEYLEL